MKRGLFLLLFTFSQVALSCSAFILQRNDFNLHAVNMDWPYREGVVVLHPRNQLRSAHLDRDNFHPLIWKSTYGSLILHGGKHGTRGPAADGMNEKGLVASALVLQNSDYDTQRIERPALNSGLWVQYVLDKFSNVQEVLDDSEHIRIMADVYRSIPLKLHLLVSDTHGDSAILEYLDGSLIISRPDMSEDKLLSNHGYAWSREQRANYKAFGGEKETPGMSDSLSRFIRASIWLKKLPAFISKEDSLAYSFALLAHVAQSPADKAPSQVSLVFDSKNLRIYWRSINEAAIRYFDLNEWNFTQPFRETAVSAYTHHAGNMISYFSKGYISDPPLTPNVFNVQ
ncbi:MAG: linear amide C-N hydrolase [Legionellaceae bacterium]|nr:linear amide C-N hydrolase [Legionellaceae bacterium]